MQYETCRHIKEDGAYCGSPALQKQKYCYYHFEHRIRRLRRARALRDNIPYRLEIPLLDSPSAIRLALSEVLQALGSGQLDHRAAGKMLYGIQMTISFNRRMAQAQAEAEAAAAKSGASHQPGGGPQLSSVGNCGAVEPIAMVQEYPEFEREFGLPPATDIDAELDWTLRKADEQLELRQVNTMPPPPGVHLTPAQFRIYREEVYQSLNMQVNSMRRDLREYYEIKRKESEKQIEGMKKPALSATPSSERLVTSA